MIEIIIGFFAGIISAMGFGGGSILIVYITAFLGVEAIKAQGINLIYFMPVAFIALIFHIINKKIDYKAGLILILSGIPGAALGALLAQFAGQSKIMKILLAVFILVIGIEELFSKKPKTENNK